MAYEMSETCKFIIADRATLIAEKSLDDQHLITIGKFNDCDFLWHILKCKPLESITFSYDEDKVIEEFCKSDKIYELFTDCIQVVPISRQNVLDALDVIDASMMYDDIKRALRTIFIILNNDYDAVCFFEISENQQGERQ